MKFLSGLIIGFIVGILATIGFLQMRSGEPLPGLNPHPAAAAPVAPAAPSGGAATGGSDANAPQKTQ